MPYFTLSNGEKLYYEDSREGEKTLVMMHGWTGTHGVYRKVRDRLKDKARVIIYDHRGHANSKRTNGEKICLKTFASDLHELLVGLDLSDVTLLGWSMGAAVAMAYLGLFGTERLRRLILCDMTPKMIDDDGWDLGLRLGQGSYTADAVAEAADEPFFKLYERFAREAIPALKLVPGFLLRLPLKIAASKNDEEVLKTTWVSMNEQDFRDCFVGLDVPVAYFYPDPGSLFAPELAEWYAQNVPTEFKAVRFEKSTHILVIEHPAKFAAEVAALL